MLDDHGRRSFGEGVDEPPRSVGIEEVEVRQRHPAVLDDAIPPPPAARLAVPGPLLVRVLAVPQHLGPCERDVLGRRQRVVAVEVADDRRVVRGRVRERGARQGAPARQRYRAGRELGRERRVLRRVDHDQDRRMVLGRGAHHRGAADVELLHRLHVGHPGLGSRGLERVQVHGHQVDARQAVGAQLGVVFGGGRREERPVDGGMERLDAAAQDLGGAGDVRHRAGGEAGLYQRAVGTTGSDELESEVDERARE